MAKKYEYHKQNEYPGERIAERKRVEERDADADKRADARVAAKGRSEELKANNRVAAQEERNEVLLDSQRDRSNARAKKIDSQRNATDSIGLAVIASLVLLILIGGVWGFVAMQNQSDTIATQSAEIDSFKRNIPNSGTQYSLVQLSEDNGQALLHTDFSALTNEVNAEIAALRDKRIVYANMHQLCSGIAEREHNINGELHKFYQDEIIYYEQIAALSNKPECETQIDNMRNTMSYSENSEYKFYMASKQLCDELSTNRVAYNTQTRNDWEIARMGSIENVRLYDEAKQSAIECLR